MDDEYTYEAVSQWQEDRGLDETGVVELGRVVFAHGKVRVESLEAEEGQSAQPGQKVLTYTGTSKVITVRLEAEDQRMAKKGAKVEVTSPSRRVEVSGGGLTEGMPWGCRNDVLHDRADEPVQDVSGAGWRR